VKIPKWPIWSIRPFAITPTTCLSDHDGQILKIKPSNFKNECNKATKQELRKFTCENIQYFSCLLKKENWEDVYFTPVENKYEVFYSIFNYYFNLAFPKTLITKKNTKNNWITEELKVKKGRLIQITKELRNFRQHKVKTMLKKEKIKFRAELNQAKAKYFEEKINKSSNIQKSVWGIINSEVGGKNKAKLSNITLTRGTNTLSNPKTIANLFNEYFVNVVGDINPNCNINTFVPDSDTNISKNKLIMPTFSLRPVTQKEVENIINLLKNKNSSGHDELSVKILKNIKYDISKILTHLINSSFIAGIFPEQLKKAKVVPIQKKMTQKILIIIDRYLYFLLYLKSMKK